MPVSQPSASRRRERRGQRRPFRDTIGFAVVFLAAALLAWQIVAVAKARSLAQEAPEEAVSWRPSDPRALGYLAERAFLDASASGAPPEAARAYARRALNAGPLEVRALRVLAWVADEEGEERRARRLMTLAASRSQRDESSHLWMFHDRLKARDFAAAFAHGDALMQHRETYQEVAVLMAAAAGADEAAAKALSERLQSGPAWRGRFVRELTASQDPDVTLSILLSVKEAGSAILPEEAAFVAGRLISERRPREAYLAWVLLLPPSGYDVLGNVYNGGFDGPPGSGPFAWTLQHPTTIIAQAPGRKGQALSARPVTDREQSLARQMLVLSPGPYRLSLDSRLDGLSEGGMEWRLSCAGDRTGALARLSVKKSDDWTHRTTTFTVPVDCGVQLIELRTEAGGGASVWGWFDDIRIESAGAEV